MGKTIDWGRAGWEVLLNDTSQMALLRAAVAETVRVRSVAIYGDFFPLTPIGLGGQWAAYQLHCPREALPGTCVAGAGAVFVFLRTGNPDYSQGNFTANLFAIEPSSSCVATLSYTYSVNSTLRVSGAELAAINIAFEEVGSSVLLEYACV